MRVWIVGAGPGDPELLTLRASRLVGGASILVYAGSLVSEEVVALAPPGCELHDSSGLSHEEVCALFLDARRRSLDLVRLHSGDPSFYGGIQEQIEFLEAEGIEYDIVPGVSSLAAAAAALGRELTVPDVTQSVIVTRQAGRTPVPPGEELAALAAHGSTLAIFLSVQLVREVARELAISLPGDTPVAVVERASRPEQRVIRGTVADIAAKVEEAGVKKTALILVGRALTASGERSRLYDPAFGHAFREATPSAPAPEGEVV